MFVEDGQGRGSLANADELLSALQDILRPAMRLRRHDCNEWAKQTLAIVWSAESDMMVGFDEDLIWQ